jgi:hypothetical protein
MLFFPGFTGGSAFEEAKNRLFAQISSISFTRNELLYLLDKTVTFD